MSEWIRGLLVEPRGSSVSLRSVVQCDLRWKSAKVADQVTSVKLNDETEIEKVYRLSSDRRGM